MDVILLSLHDWFNCQVWVPVVSESISRLLGEELAWLFSNLWQSELCHGKTCLCHMRTKAQVSLHIRAVRSASLDSIIPVHAKSGERGGSVVECRTPEREVRGSRPTAAVLCPWARHFTPRKYWLITQEAMVPSRHDWKIVDLDVKPQHNQPTC